MSASNNIKVVCRFRPPNKIELANNGGESIVQIDEEGTTVKLQSQEAMKGPDAQGFTFDRVFQMDTKQEEVFEYGVKGIVDGELRIRQALFALMADSRFADVMNGYNGTVFAYGQTGSGKSHTMMVRQIPAVRLPLARSPRLLAGTGHRQSRDEGYHSPYHRADLCLYHRLAGQHRIPRQGFIHGDLHGEDPRLALS